MDGWSVDHGLVDGAGELVAPPFSYRDGRTEAWMSVADRIRLDRLYDAAGIQLMPINTVIQLALHDRDELDRAERMYLLPDLLVIGLTGFGGAGRSNASTTGLVDARSGEWSRHLATAAGIHSELFPDVAVAGTQVGAWDGIPVHLVGSHDTASAFLAMPGGSEPGTVMVSTGTWVIVGVERDVADTSAAANAANFSNEAGAFGGFRFLKNVMGFWMLERCRERWGDASLDDLLGEASEVDGAPRFDATDPRFLAPDDMETEVRGAAALPPGASRGLVVRSILESIAFSVAGVVDVIADVAGLSPRRVVMVGGGARGALFERLVSSPTGLPVVTGSTEATALGNALAQGIALGRFDDVPDAQQWLVGRVTDRGM